MIIRDTKLLCPTIWAENSGYKVTPIEWHRQPLTNKIFSYPGVEAAKQVALDDDSTKQAVRISAHDVRIIIFNWGPSNTNSNYKYFLLSRNGDLFIDNPTNSSSWLKYFPIFSEINCKSVSIDLDTSTAHPITKQNNSEHVFVGGHTHYGHWLLDSLPIYLTNISRNMGAHTTYMSSKLTAWQKSILTSIGIQSDFFEFDVGENRISVIRIDEVIVYGGLGISGCINTLRRSIGADAQHPQPNQDKPVSHDDIGDSLIYMARGEIRGRNRLINETDLISHLKKRGFKIIIPHEHSIQEMKILLKNARIVVCAPGAAHVNFSIFTSQSAVMIYIIQESYLDYHEQSVLGANIYLTPDLDRIIFLRALQPALTNRENAEGDLECVVLLRELDIALAQAETMTIK